MSPAPLQLSFEVCRDLTRQHARSFYFASHALPAAKRRDAYAVYAFCRYADDAIDLAPDEAARTLALSELRILLEDLYSNQSTGHAWAPAFMDTVFRCGIPRQLCEELLTGMAMDQGRVRLADWSELRTYCYHVASVVGLMMTRVFAGPRPDLEPYAIDLGIALQLTNIIRDVAEDAARDRIYLPATDLDQYGVTENDIFSGQLTSGFHALLRFQIQRSRDYYARCEPGIRGLPNDGSQLTVQLMRTLYAGILDEVEKLELNVFAARASTSTPRKCVLAFHAWRQCR